MSTNVFFAAAPVKNYEVACEWYGRIFNRLPDMVPNEIEAAWKFSDAAWMYVIVDSSRAGNALLFQMIDDVNAHVANLEKRGLTPTEIEEVAGKYRKVSYRDPDGNMIAFGSLY
jgi:hypothetical protein